MGYERLELRIRKKDAAPSIILAEEAGTQLISREPMLFEDSTPTKMKDLELQDPNQPLDLSDLRWAGTYLLPQV